MAHTIDDVTWADTCVVSKRQLGLEKVTRTADFLRAVHQRKLHIHSAARLALQAL